MSKSEIPAAVPNRYQDLIATHPEAERKGSTIPYTSVNGHMFSLFTGSGTTLCGK